MTFLELYAHIYDETGNINGKIKALEPVDRLAWQIYRAFMSRGGFDWWWSGIDDESKNEIFDQLRDIVGRVL